MVVVVSRQGVGFELNTPQSVEQMIFFSTNIRAISRHADQNISTMDETESRTSKFFVRKTVNHKTARTGNVDIFKARTISLVKGNPFLSVEICRAF